ncbi:hypothetical protein K432DRAFT_208849 [Lepidopterella palustris CBS 459.81]|uniref:Uncharacterized protein n=1 Tax=Lepidopterella palustris CBS 459.81 TaxID=1314670 RepID=A0A8E2JHT3_9PEZI|nr:hypothetical protein K432DRAFT_208849 [Lepidopterella palustris CBS 459.81]
MSPPFLFLAWHSGLFPYGFLCFSCPLFCLFASSKLNSSAVQCRIVKFSSLLCFFLMVLSPAWFGVLANYGGFLGGKGVLGIFWFVLVQELRD